MNNHWGYCNFDYQYKTPQMLVRKLVECVSKGGNMILNVGPDGKGNIPTKSEEILTEMGKWMEKIKRAFTVAVFHSWKNRIGEDIPRMAT